MHALVRFSHIAAQNSFTTSEIYADTLAALAASPQDYSLASLRYDLSKLRAKGLVEKVPRSRRYRLLRESRLPETV
jgi:DNA-binding transcriptional ArsR family regulator